MARKSVIKEINNRKFRINEIPPLQARRVLIRYNESLKSDNFGENNELAKIIFGCVEVECGKDNWVRLDNEEIINQNTDVQTLLEIESEVLNLTTGFSQGGSQ